MVETNLCGKDLGDKPWWMNEYQYDPCPCLLPANHLGDCKCKHIMGEVQSGSAQ